MTALHGDDAGYHAASVKSAVTENHKVVSVRGGSGEGELVLTAEAVGETRLKLEISGWGGEELDWTLIAEEEPVAAAGVCPEPIHSDSSE